MIITATCVLSMILYLCTLGCGSPAPCKMPFVLVGHFHTGHGVPQKSRCITGQDQARIQLGTISMALIMKTFTVTHSYYRAINVQNYWKYTGVDSLFIYTHLLNCIHA
jgi:hypothetical protein